MRPVYYRNGNYQVTINSQGVKTRKLDKGETEWKPDRLENIDLCISRKCRFGCPMCYNDSTPDGPVADYENIASILNQVPEGTEVAIGGGALTDCWNTLLVNVLNFCKTRKLIANITLKQEEFEEKFAAVKHIQQEGLAYGVGVSIVNPTTRLLGMLTDIDYAVAHCIVGWHDRETIWKLRGVPVLLLGFKQMGRAKDKELDAKIADFREWFWDNFKQFYRVGFDNLSLKQLEVRRHLDKEQFDKAYLGEDGTGFNCYIDAMTSMVWRSSLLQGNGYSLKEMSLGEAVDKIKKEQRC